MHNNILTIGKLTVHGYGLMIAIGLLATLFVTCHRAKKRALSVDAVESIVLLAVIFGFLGAKLLYVIVNFKAFLEKPMSVLGSEGFVVYGGIIVGVLAAYIYCRRKKLDFLTYADLCMPGVALAQGFGRLGCFMAGCCYGAETDSVLGVVFPAGSMAPAGVKLWPTQLFSAVGDFILCVILLLLAQKKSRRGMILGLYLAFYSVGRFIVEFFRNDARGFVGALSTSQFISIFILAAAVLVLLYTGKRPAASEKVEPETVPEEPTAEAAAEPVIAEESAGETEAAE